MDGELCLQITGTGSELQGVGRAADGRAVFVPGALPGEAVRVRVTREATRFMEAELVGVDSAHPSRTDPACPHYGMCGGCCAQHMDYALTLELKRRRVCDALQRIGGLEVPVRPTLGMANPYRCRNKAEYPIDGRDIGGSARRGRRVENLQDCLLQHPSSVAAMRETRRWLERYAQPALKYLVTRVAQDGSLMAVLCAQGAVRGLETLTQALFARAPGMKSMYLCVLKSRPAHALDGTCRLIRGEELLVDKLLGLEFELAPQAFFQVNREQAEALFTVAREAAALTGRETLVDAYCGAGAIGLCLARDAGQVLGVELIPEAVENARRNARRNGITNARFVQDRAERVLPEWIAGGLRPDVVTVDPPRKGMDPALVQALRRAAPERLVYVSCDPATLARDVALLAADGCFQPQWAQPVDMFPWSAHVETVCLLSKLHGSHRA